MCPTLNSTVVPSQICTYSYDYTTKTKHGTIYMRIGNIYTLI